AGDVRAVERVALDRVTVDRLEVAGRPGKADRGGVEVVVHLGDEVEHLNRVLVLVRLPGERHRRVPRTDEVRRHAGVPGERGERVRERLLAARGDVLARIVGVVVVQVEVHVSHVAGQAW